MCRRSPQVNGSGRLLEPHRLIADQIPEVAQSRRLGHRIPDKIQHIYSHVAPELEARVLDTLQQRWTAALAELATPSWTTAVAEQPALPTASVRGLRAAS